MMKEHANLGPTSRWRHIGNRVGHVKTKNPGVQAWGILSIC